MELDNLSKVSHKSGNKIKTLAEHIEEVKTLSYTIAKNHNLLVEDILNTLSYWHDLGKLNPKWNIENNRNPPHSALSSYLYLTNSKDVDPIIFFLILKHHTYLKITDYRNVVSDIKKAMRLEVDKKRIYSILKQLHEKLKDYKANIIYADLFGIFKTADIISAMFEDYIIERPNIDQIEYGVKEYVKSKKLKFDKDRWNIFCDIGNTNGDILLKAPTGWGKTFASLMVAKNNTHIIYILPTITAIRKMRDVLKAILNCNVEENYYFADVEKIREETQNVDFNLFISKSFMSPVTITTIDQIILTFLQVGRYFLRRYHFRNSLFIIDEFHAYPINGLLILLHFIKKFNEEFEYNIRTVFMTATSHPFLENIICEYINPITFDFTKEYEKRRRYLYKIESTDILDEESLKEIVKKTEEGTVLVICNTVEKAIKVYLRLKNDYNLKNILLLHSRFTYNDRRNKEDILSKISSNKGFVLVSTQVAEVSLDISFDYLFTEIAPIPALIQRFGRVNRYSTHTDDVNVFIFYPNDIGKRYPYDKDEIKTTFNELIEVEDKIKNELILIKSYWELPLHFDKNELNEIERYLTKWEEDTKYFFSLDLTDDELNKLLRFRDTNTVLVVPRCFKSEVEDILLNEDKFKLQKIKKYFTPVPIWWIIESLKQNLIESVGNIPILSNPQFEYSHEIGYFDKDKLTEYLDQIEIWRDETAIL